MWEASAQDTEGNVTKGDVLLEEVRNTLIDAEKQLVGCLGVYDLIFVATPDAVRVGHRDRVQEVRRLVNRLKAQGRAEADLHREVYRPWGSFDAIGTGYCYKVKRITVKPGARLSRQLHHHRAEH